MSLRLLKGYQYVLGNYIEVKKKQKKVKKNPNQIKTK